MIAPQPRPLWPAKARLALDCPCACSGVKALRNTSAAKAARRQAAQAFRSLDPLRALREADRRRRDEERPFQLRTKNWPKDPTEHASDRPPEPIGKGDSHDCRWR